MKTTSLLVKALIGPIFLPPSFVLIGVVLTYHALSPAARALSPPPDGGYPGGNTAEGQSALLSLTSGAYNTAVGFFALGNNTEGQFNTAIGAGALLSNNNTGFQNAPAGIINSSQNTALGAAALLNNTTGANNTATGSFALLSNTTGGFNTATGASALLANSDGTRNTAHGADALSANTIGIQNTANGAFALFSNTEGSFNTAIGDSALYSNIDGGTNTAIGGSALQNNSHGDGNTAIGDAALSSNTTGMFNTAIGRSALSGNTVGNGNIAIGIGAGSDITNGNGDIDIGSNPVADESDTIRIGDMQTSTFIAGINGIAVTGVGVVVSASGQLGVAPSSERFKEKIKPMDCASEAILALKPVTFRYRKEIDPARMAQFGLVAEEVEKVNPDLVVHDKKGKPYTVRYDAVNAMLLNEFLKEHRKVEKLEATVLRQRDSCQSRLAKQERQIQALTAGLQKVSARLEISNAGPQVMVNNP
jgi:Chaperone of endosialidase